jgi:antitoxin VapB
MSTMALSIRNSRTEALARELARQAGESITDAITRALEDRLARIRNRRVEQDLAAQLMEIAARCREMPDLDSRSAEEILGYDADGAVG